MRPEQAEQISESLLAGERHARAKKALQKHPDYGAACLASVTPCRRRAIVAAARRNVNSRWTTGLVILVPMVVYAVAMWLGDGVFPEYLGVGLPILLFVPAIVVHAKLVRREIEALAALEPGRH